MSHINKIKCEIKVSEVPLHLYQILAGFTSLNSEGIIDMKVTPSKAKLPYNMMEVVINESFKALFDVNDGYDNLKIKGGNYVKFMDNILENYDVCFKRSCSDEYNETLKNGKNIYPLGLNYMVTINKNIAHKPFKDDPRNEKIKKLIRMIPFSQYYNGKYTINAFEQYPMYSKDPKILFMVRLWDPEGNELKDLSKNKVEERKYINDVRVKCIEKCRKEFGNKFLGGLIPNAYSIKNYPKLLIKDKGIAKRDSYLKIMKKSDICIATTGLHKSIGWKFGEYVAASRAIVSEKLNYKLPGDFEKNKNYLEFNTADQCIDNTYKLLDNHDFRFAMMKENHKYYHHYVAPDKLVLNTLLKCLGEMRKSCY